MSDYPPPVDSLLTCGGAKALREDAWPDYPATFGLGPEHIPDLIRLASDQGFNQAEPEDPRVWAPLHAWRALGQLRAEGAVDPLLDVLVESARNHDDWGTEELPVVFGMIGPAAIPALTLFLADDTKGEFARIAAAWALQQVAEVDPRARDECAAVLTRQLEAAERNEPGLNGFLIGYLMDLDAVEAAPVMERAFAAGLVDEMVAGRWVDVRYKLGLGPPPPPRKPWFDFLPGPEPPSTGNAPRRPSDTMARAKARRKLEKRSRKQKRKRR